MRLPGNGIKSMRPIFKNKLLNYHSKANLDEKILLCKIHHLRGLYGNPEFHVPFWSMIYEAMKFTLSVPEIEF